MKKNVMVILCDQLRADYLSCYNENSPVKTPNIDALVKDGVMFQNAVTASPVCAPGRACMMTGRYVSDHGVWTNDVAFREGIEFLPQRMHDNGYACGAFGKLHHFPAKDSKGFDYAWQMEENRLGEEDDYYKYIHSVHEEVKEVFPNKEKFVYSEDEYYENQIAKRAMNFIESVKNEKNFFAWVSFQGPHGPLDPPEIDYKVDLSSIEEPLEPDFVPPCEVTKYRRSRSNDCDMEQIRKYRESYVKLIEHIDNQVERIVTYLKENNLYENTVIMFSTDHGDMCGDYRMWQKGPFLYSNQLEVPLIVANHNDLPKNVKTNMLTGNIDIVKTALSVAGDDKELGYSKDIAKMYNDENSQRKTYYSEFCDSMKLISTKEYRCAYFPFTGECELVKVGEERVNLANKPEYQELKAKFLCDMIDYMVVSKGVKIEAQDLTPKVQEGLDEKMPNWKDEIELVFPVASMKQIKLLEKDGLDTKFNEFCKEREVTRYYGRYWDGERQKHS